MSPCVHPGIHPYIHPFIRVDLNVVRVTMNAGLQARKQGETNQACVVLSLFLFFLSPVISIPASIC